MPRERYGQKGSGQLGHVGGQPGERAAAGQEGAEGGEGQGREGLEAGEGWGFEVRGVKLRRDEDGRSEVNVGDARNGEDCRAVASINEGLYIIYILYISTHLSVKVLDLGDGVGR